MTNTPPLRKRSEALRAGGGAPPPPPPVQEAAQKLKDEMKAQIVNEKQAERPKPPPLLVNANRGPGLTEEFLAVVETVFTIDALKDYKDLEENLAIGEQRADYQTVLRCLDEAETKARKAHKLYLGSKLELQNWQLDIEPVEAAMRQRSLDELEAEKELGERKKQITEADVKGRTQFNFPEEYKHQQQNRVKIEGTVKHLERLSELWMQRCKTLGTMLSTLRK